MTCFIYVCSYSYVHCSLKFTLKFIISSKSIIQKLSIALTFERNSQETLYHFYKHIKNGGMVYMELESDFVHKSIAFLT